MEQQAGRAAIGSPNVAAALIISGAKLERVERDSSGQVVFHLSGRRVHDAIAKFHARELTGNIPEFLSALNYCRDLITGRREFNAQPGVTR